MGCCTKVCGTSFLVVIAAIAVQLGLKYINLQDDQAFGLTTAHSEIVNPPAYKSRYRGAEHTKDDEFFFQWWNFLVFDAETRDHWNIIYQVTNYADGSTSPDAAMVAMMHLQGSEPRMQAHHAIPLGDLDVRNDFDLLYNVDGNVKHSQIIVDDDTYHLKADFSADKTNVDTPVSWDLTFHRLHGLYPNPESQEDNDKAMCLLASTLWGYNSEVEGTITAGDKVFTVSRNSRFRAYAAGSWGCDLPNGRPAIEYPWTWFWLVIPDVPALKGQKVTDIGMVMGTARFQEPAGALLGDIYGGFSAVGMGDVLHSTRHAQLHHNTSFAIPMQNTASDSYLSVYNATQSEWATYEDEFGSALVPLRQEFHIVTKNWEVRVDFHSTIDQYFRAPVHLEKNFEQRVFSDFRAVGITTDVLIRHRYNGTVIYDGTVDTMNALEYAYEPELDIQKMVSMGLTETA